MIKVLAFAILGHSLYYAILFGKTENPGYYFMDLWVGTPPKLQTVIIDTGSRLTAIPCEGCKKCGKHMNEYYDYSTSNTSRVLNCTEKVKCKKCYEDRCVYTQNFAEGSSISGHLIEESIIVGDDLSNSPIKATIGCNTKETNLFLRQGADGIMGLTYSKDNVFNIIDLFYKESIVEDDVFSLCYGMDRGFLTIGGVNENFNTEKIKWAKLKGRVFYQVLVDYIQIEKEGSKIDIDEKSSSETIIDSGTTFSYFTAEIYKNMIKYFTQFCKGKGKCLAKNVKFQMEPHDCYKCLDCLEDLENSPLLTFPTIYFGIGREIIEWSPVNYMIRSGAQREIFCPGFYTNGVYGGNILGSNFFRGKQITFDRDDFRVGFAKSECDYGFINTTVDVDMIHKDFGVPMYGGVRFYILMYLMYLISLVMVGIMYFLVSLIKVLCVKIKIKLYPVKGC